MSEPNDLINKKWFVAEAGSYGYEICAKHDDLAQYYPVANGLEKEIAEHIVEIHNSWYTMKFLGAKIQGFFEEVNKSLNSFNDKLKNEGINKK